jgi:hypothetical protein
MSVISGIRLGSNIWEAQSKSNKPVGELFKTSICLFMVV